MVEHTNRALTSSKGGRYKITAFLRSGRGLAKEPPHEALANLRDDVAAGWTFYDRWGALVSESLITEEQASSLRSAAVASPYVNLEYRDHLRRAWRGDRNSLDFIERSAGQYMRFSWSFKSGQIELLPEDLWSTICLLFLRDRAAHKIGFCENPDCAQPYFIRRKVTQKFCTSGTCTEYAQRCYALKWWNAAGKKQRQDRRKKERRTA